MYEYDEFARCVGNLKKRIQKRVSDALKPYNLSSMHSMYLMTLYHKGELTLVELSGELKFNRANTSRVIRDLIQKGYVVLIRKRFTDTGFSIRFDDLRDAIAHQFVIGFSRHPLASSKSPHPPCRMQIDQCHSL